MAKHSIQCLSSKHYALYSAMGQKGESSFNWQLYEMEVGMAALVTF